MKILSGGVLFLLLISTVGSIGITKKDTPQPLGVLEYEPKSHDFGNMIQGEINYTMFEIWTSGGCCELIFNLTWNCSWVTVFPTSGVTNGEHIPITVTVDTHGLDNGFHDCDILITTNGGGDGIFNVTLNVIKGTRPTLAFNPQTFYFGIIPENTVETTGFDIWNSGNGTLEYSLSSTKNWVSVSPISGNSLGEHDPITVTINTDGLLDDTVYECDVEITSNGGDDIFVVTVTIGTVPEFEITSIKGGLFNIKTAIKNIGTADATGVDWKVTISGLGLVLLGKETTGTIPSLPINGEQTISTGLVFGFGTVIVTFIIQNDEAMPIVVKRTAKLFMSYIKL